MLAILGAVLFHQWVHGSRGHLRLGPDCGFDVFASSSDLGFGIRVYCA
jgi:hypothetical protein